MSLSAPLEVRARARPARSTKFQARPQPRAAKAPDGELRPELSTAELAFRVYAAFRAHPHVSNVLTHISRAKWAEVEQSINSILDPATKSGDLSPLGQNIVDLMVAERGITGKILKPYFHAVLYRLLDPPRPERLIRQIEALFLDLEWKATHPAPPPALNESPGSQTMSETHGSERVINVADIDPRYRHAILFRLFENLAPDDSLQIVVDHDPKRLRLQLEELHGSRCGWSYLEAGPDVWRVRLRLFGRRTNDHG